MWKNDSNAGKSVGSNNLDNKSHDTVFNELMQECKVSPAGARLSTKVRNELEKMRPEERTELCRRKRDGCAPLFVASKRGNVEIVEYLIHVCAADLEQRGVFEVAEENAVHTVTPLWCAAVAGRVPVLRALVEAGADLNACSDSGSTPVRSACFMTRVEAVEFLVERGADIHRPNHNGGTCLINSVQSPRLLKLLLGRGAKVDACDMQRKTALHYAVQEQRVEAARLLLQHGANPRLVCCSGDDALRLACLKGAAQAVAVLTEATHFCPARVADAYELLGATQLDDFNDLTATLLAWRRATAIRNAYGPYIDKRPQRPPQPALGNVREWRTAAELETLALDVDAVRTQSLLVAERVLGPAHKDTIFRLMYRGAAYADAFRYQRCIDLWTWALQIRLHKDSLLFSDSSTDTCHTASALTRLLLDAHGSRLERARGLPRHVDVVRVFALLAEHLPSCRRALDARPVHKKQAETFDRALRCVTHLLHLLAETRGAQRAAVCARVRRLLAADVRSAHTGDTLLHLAVSRLNVVRSTYFADEVPDPPVFPSVGVVTLLLECGAPHLFFAAKCKLVEVFFTNNPRLTKNCQNVFTTLALLHYFTENVECKRPRRR
ncbi:Protein fem-1-like A [Papilio xuthus]|uniref:Protein fem-1-like A n=1 Tax=Papilio xuthus TaxID=66420 RepID=A0A194PKV8_PAPXU|nr:Protein fem-1-like A [Papilio xuthus]